MLAILGTFAAIKLALRSNVVLLLLAILVGWAVVLVNGVATASSAGAIGLHMILVAVGLQLGFMAALVLEWAVVAGLLHSEVGKPTTVRLTR